MKINTEYIHQIILDKMSGAITDSENDYLEKLIETDESVKNIWLEYQQALKGAKAYHFSNTLDADTAWQKVQGKIAAPVIAIKPVSKKYTFLWAAASVAGIMGLFLLGSLFIRKPTTTIVSTTIARPNSILLQINNQKIEIGGLDNDLTINSGTKSIKDFTGHPINTNLWANNETATLQVPDGKRCTVHLSDGTSVMLNAGSLLTFPLGLSTSLREVSLVGEAYFNVTKNPKAPFIVNANSMSVKVLGTVFDLKAYPKEASSVSLFSGHVLVKNVKTNDSAFLTLGQMVEIDPFANDEMAISKLDTSLAIGWQKGIFYFTNKPLENIGQLIERQYDIKVIVKGNELKSKRLTGVIEASQPITVFIDFFSKVAGIKYSFQKDSLLIYK